MTNSVRLLLTAMVLSFRLWAQLEPEGSQVISYFPQLADGGSASQRWFTTLTFVNSNSSVSAAGIATFYDDNGNPLAIDFGSGAVASINFKVAPGGTITLTSTGLSPSEVFDLKPTSTRLRPLIKSGNGNHSGTTGWTHHAGG